MTTIDGDTSTDGLALLLGPRQADVMRLLWLHGPATVKALHERLHAAYGLAYTTVMTLCVQLYEKGLLDRYRVEAAAAARIPA